MGQHKKKNNFCKLLSAESDKMSRILILVVGVLALLGFVDGRISQISDDYLWTDCSPFESTKKNCPRGEQCLKLKSYQTYAWDWAMRCQSREEFISRFDFELQV